MRASLTAQGIAVVDFPVHLKSATRPDPPHGPTTTAAAAAGEAAGENPAPATAAAAAAGEPSAAAAVVEAAAGEATTAAGTSTAAEAVRTAVGEAATAAVAKELYRRGLLVAAWEVGPATAAFALKGGHIQRALVRRRRAAGATGAGDNEPRADHVRCSGEHMKPRRESGENAGGAAGEASGEGAAEGARRQNGGRGEERSQELGEGGEDRSQVNGGGKEEGEEIGGAKEEEEEEEEAALKVVARLCGQKGVCVRRGGAVPGGLGEKNYTEVLLPVAPVRQSSAE